ncbi:YodL domain-containing protein [uncultured Oscillibacter sp.]|uniref:YodL domain-containing protein n=1 Tax=uncultured Oscillibacter sp. TaxID=876091 RepID=UPI002605D3C3|nr:YodL domain-containing protein [uncultured Oscillibacter sp.]
MRGDTPVNIAGVVAFPNDEGGARIRFIDSSYNTLFFVPDGGSIVFTPFGGDRELLPCRYLDDYHAIIGGRTFHICEFAESAEQRGAVYAPEHPREGDILDTYTIYQLGDIGAVPYAFMPYDQAKAKLRFSHYRRAYRGVLAPKVTLDDLYLKHNQDSRPFGQRMHSLSMSDVIVLNRGGTEKAYYVDTVGFQEAKRFLNPPVWKRKPPAQER